MTNLAEAESQLARQSVATVFVASGLDSRTPGETIRWFAQKIAGAVIIALLERGDDLDREEALEAEASCICSKLDLLVAQLRREVGARVACPGPQRPSGSWSESSAS